MEDIEHYNIPIYNFPYDVEEDEEDTIEENSELRVNDTQPIDNMLDMATNSAYDITGTFTFLHHW